MSRTELMQDVVTVGDLPAINHTLLQGDQVLIIPIKGGMRAFRIKREEIAPLNRAKSSCATPGSVIK